MFKNINRFFYTAFKKLITIKLKIRRFGGFRLILYRQAASLLGTVLILANTTDTPK
jgi:hypothetical protein